MLDKYFLSCLVLSFAMSAVSGISLDYYFGLDDALRSAQYIEDCNSRRTLEICQQQCGPNHACLLGKCFCASVKPPIKEGGNSIGPRLPGDSRCNKLRTKLKVLDEFLEKTRSIDDRRDPSSENDISAEEFEVNENNKYYLRLDEKALRPSLRHHIAHFCPNLDIARKCIRKCMERGKPAFCGKDHVCYCGHRYDSYHQDVPVNVNDTYAAFQDLYEKYFGPRIDPTSTTDKNKILLDNSETASANGANESGSKESGFKESGSKESGSKESGSKESGSKESRSKESGSKESGSKESGSKESGSKETESKETGSKETGSKETESKETGSKESATTSEKANTESETTTSAPANAAELM